MRGISANPNAYETLDTIVKSAIKNTPESLSAKGQVAFSYIIDSKIIELDQQMSGGLSPDQQSHRESLIQYSQRVKSEYKIDESEVIYLVGGAPLKQYLDGKIDLHPCEGAEFSSPDNHRELEKFERKQRSSQTSIVTNPGQKVSEESTSPVDMTKVNAIIGEPRETSTIKEMAGSNITKTQPVSVFVFGNYHNFGNNVENYNRHNPYKFSLLRIKTTDIE